MCYELCHNFWLRSPTHVTGNSEHLVCVSLAILCKSFGWIVDIATSNDVPANFDGLILIK